MSQLQVTGEAKIRDIQGPVVANSGVITALDGDASQYVRGDGTLADFPTSTGGGSSVSYYLNSSVSQGTIGGVVYRQLGKTPIAGAGTDIVISANGYVASYITDANDPALLEVPAGNFNCEFYFSVNNNTGNPFTYAEVYKYDGTTFTLIGTSVGVPEYINQGTVINPYYFAVPVAQSVLTVTDRIAIRIYVNVDGRTVTLHTENNHLCQVVTTFSKGLISLNNLTRQNQFFGTGTDGTDFNISSVTATHTFNLPVASATNTGKLSSTDWSTFNGKVPYTGATANVDLGNFNFDANEISGGAIIAKLNGPASSPFILKSGSSGYVIGDDAISLVSSPTTANTLILASNIGVVTKTAQIGLGSLSATRTYTLPDASGTLALTSNLSSYVPYTGATASVNLGTFALNAGAITTEAGYAFKILAAGTLFQNGYSVMSSLEGNISLTQAISAGNLKAFTFDFSSWATNTSRTFTLPDLSGTLALLEGTQTFTGLKTFGDSIQAGYGISLYNGIGTGALVSATYTGFYAAKSGTYTNITFAHDGDPFFSRLKLLNNATYDYTFPAASGTIALTSDLGAYVTLGTAQTISGAKTFSRPLRFANNSPSIDFYAANDSTYYGSLFVNSSFYQFTAAGTADWKFQNQAGNTVFQITQAGVANFFYALNGTTLGLTGALSGTSATFSGNVGIGMSPITANGGLQLANNGTAAPSIYFTNGTTASYFGIDAFGTNVFGGGTTGPFPFIFVTNSSEKMRITSGGNVGIGTNSPTSLSGYTILSINNATYGGLIDFLNNNTLQGRIGADQAGMYIQGKTSIPMIFATNDTERMRITSGGNVGIGTSSPSNFSNYTTLSISGTNGGVLDLMYQGTTQFRLSAENGNNYLTGVTNAPIIFATNTTERARISSTGYFKASNNSTYVSTTVDSHEFNNNTSNWITEFWCRNAVSPYGLRIKYNNASPNSASNQPIYFDDSTAVRFYLNSNGGIANFQANDVNLSDERTKKDIIPLESYWDKFKAIEIVKFKYKDQTHDDYNIGVIAQQVEAVAPEFIDVDGWGKPELDEDGNEIVSDEEPLKSVYSSDLHHATIKVLQECMIKIEELKAEIEILKNK